jgi:hypothetical protein
VAAEAGTAMRATANIVMVNTFLNMTGSLSGYKHTTIYSPIDGHCQHLFHRG